MLGVAAESALILAAEKLDWCSSEFSPVGSLSWRVQLREVYMLVEVRRSCAVCSCHAPKDARVVFQHQLLRLISQTQGLESLLPDLAIAYQLGMSLR